MSEDITYIPTLVGFLGVVLTLLVNAWLSRNQQERSVQHERSVLRVALQSELCRVRELINQRIKTLTAKPTNLTDGSTRSIIFSFVNSENLSVVYESQLHKIGLLTQAEANSVVRSYAFLKELRTTAENLMSIYDDLNDNDTLSASGLPQLQLGHPLTEEIAQLHKIAQVEIEKSISLLAK